MRRHTGQLGGHAQTHGAAQWTCADTRGSSVDMRRHTGQLGGQSHPTGFCGVCTHCLSTHTVYLSAHTVCLHNTVCLHTVCLSAPAVCLSARTVCLSAHSVCLHTLGLQKKKKKKKARGVRKTCLAVSQPYGDHAPSRFTGPPALPTAGCKAFVVVVLRGNPSGHYRGQSVSADLG